MTASKGSGRKGGKANRTRDLDVSFYEDPTHSIGHLARLSFRRFFRRLEERTLPYGVSSGQWGFLRVLWNEDGLTQRELSYRVDKREPTTVIALKSLERQKLVIRRPSTEDRRRVHVYLTARAQALKNKLLPFVAEVNAQATRGFTEKERAVLRELLNRVVANLAETEDKVAEVDEMTI
jgi:DNA-binding MarR family transcriptional regulator